MILPVSGVSDICASPLSFIQTEKQIKVNSAFEFMLECTKKVERIMLILHCKGAHPFRYWNARFYR